MAEGGAGIRVAPEALGSGTPESGAKEPLVFAQAGSAQSGDGAPSQPRDLLSGIRWNLARPLLRWSGFVGADFFVDKSEFVNARTFNAYTTLLGTADTYLWQPWFAQIQANLGLSAYYNNTTNRETGGPEGGGNPEQTTYGWNGGARINVFPFSRFPFEAYLDKSDVRTYATLFDQSQDNLRMGVRQRYQTRRGDQNYGFSWDRSILDQTYSNVPNVDDTLDVFILNGAYGIANQSLAAGVEYDRDRRSDGYASDNVNAVAQHTWLPSARWNVNSVGSIRNMKISQPATSTTQNQFAQIYSLANWTPPDLPMSGFGTLRLATNSSETGPTESDGYDAAAAVSGNYYYSRNTTLSGLFSVNTSNVETFTNTLATAYYGADIIPLGEWQYFWSTSGTVNNIAGGNSAGTSANAALGQSLNRSLGLWWGGETTTGLNLALGATAGTGAFETTSSVSFGANLSWNRSFGDTQATASLSASDAMTYGDIQTNFALINAQLTVIGQLSRYSAWNGDLTVQWTRNEQTNPELGPTVTPILNDRLSTTQTYVNINLGYTNYRVFDVPRLVFNSNLRTYTTNLSQSASNVLTDLPTFAGFNSGVDNQAVLEWDNRLYYYIGKTELELRAIVNTINVDNQGDTTRWQVGFRILRRLGF